MPAEMELEIKLSVPDQRLWEKLLSDPELQAMQEKREKRVKPFEALYFDTADFSLQQAGIAYRLRHEGEVWVATLKSDHGSSGALFSREELNRTVTGPEPAVDYFAGTPLGERLASLVGGRSMQILFSTKFERTTLLLRAGEASLAEMAMDRGMIWGGSTGVPISELELELKEGHVSDLLHLAGWVAAHFQLHPEPLSKYARGMALLQTGSEPAAPSRSSAGFEPAVLLTDCISGIFAAQSVALRARGTPESIKALRIQLRKLRSVLKFVQPFLQQDTGAVHLDKLKTWGVLLGSIRDIDVLQAAWVDFSGCCAVPGKTAGGWQDLIAERRDFLAATALYRLGRAELTRDLFELQAWLLTTELIAASGGGPTEKQYRKALIARIEELRDEVGKLRGIPEMKQLHALRIRTKKLRYLLETIQLVSDYRDEALLVDMKKMQAMLGKIHDIYQIKSLLEALKNDHGDMADQTSLLQLFIGWRSRDVLKTFFALPAVFESFRRAAKNYLRSLAALRNRRQAKPGHDADPHEPFQLPDMAVKTEAGRAGRPKREVSAAQ